MLCCDREKKLEQRGEKKVSRQKTTTIFSLKVCFIWGQKRPKKANTYAISILESGNSLPLEQSFPVHWPRQTHFWVSRSKSPWPEQSGRHCLASLSTMAQVGPLQPWRHTHEPSTQNPWPVHVGSGQSSENRIELNSRKILLAKKSCFFHTEFPTKKIVKPFVTKLMMVIFCCCFAQTTLAHVVKKTISCFSKESFSWKKSLLKVFFSPFTFLNFVFASLKYWVIYSKSFTAL